MSGERSTAVAKSPLHLASGNLGPQSEEQLVSSLEASP